MKEINLLKFSGQKQNKQEKPFNFREVRPDEFIEKRDLLLPDLQAFLTIYKAWDYQKLRTRLYLSIDNHCGFGINPDGQLISVFSLKRERGRMLVYEAVSMGGKYLSCLGEKLRELYSEAGFKVTNESEWNEDYAPPGWNKEKFGTPKYYEMKL